MEAGNVMSGICVGSINVGGDLYPDKMCKNMCKMWITYLKFWIRYKKMWKIKKKQKYFGMNYRLQKYDRKKVPGKFCIS